MRKGEVDFFLEYGKTEFVSSHNRGRDLLQKQEVLLVLWIEMGIDASQPFLVTVS
ncbi:hypothetical protein CSUI_004592 [Cystoisospora suis]|uniref:Uncharacterized protein n=1 Tax=Cystoisospora suis TaxID=483139 RepID=A0A2C6L0F3_9APIC|nr:hypothetical protein CSUI_004592 [Cystoisospora suis]